MKDTLDEPTDRKAWMSLLATSPTGRAAELFDAALPRPAFTWLRAPEIGSVMVQGRTGGTGAPFNLGEMTVTRCALTLSSGQVGHAYIQGRRTACAEVAALIDALMQTDQAAVIQRHVIDPLATERAQARQNRAEKAAATKVDFFTMTRGED